MASQAKTTPCIIALAVILRFPCWIGRYLGLFLCGSICVCFCSMSRRRGTFVVCVLLPCNSVASSFLVLPSQLPLFQDLFQEGSDTVLWRCYVHLQWWTFIFRMQTFQKFLVTLPPLTHSPQLFVFFFLWLFLTPIFLFISLRFQQDH